MDPFSPELGQALMSNSPWAEYEMDMWVQDGVSLLDYFVCDGGYDHVANHGGEEFDNGVFQLRAYCWCDGEGPGHEKGCPPNFQCGDFEARWYKHIGRGNSQNRAMPLSEWKEIIQLCLGSLDA